MEDPIIAKFREHKAKETIKKKASRPRGTSIGVDEQFSPKTTRKLQLLAPMMEEARQQDKEIQLRRFQTRTGIPEKIRSNVEYPAEFSFHNSTYLYLSNPSRAIDGIGCHRLVWGDYQGACFKDIMPADPDYCCWLVSSIHKEEKEKGNLKEGVYYLFKPPPYEYLR